MDMKLWELLSPTTGRLDELMNQPLAWDWATKSRHGWIAQFDVDDDRFDVTLSHGDGVTDIMFTSAQHGTDISGRGSQFQIFATVADIARSFFKENPQESIRFSAKEPSRSKLYHRLAGMIARELGWTVRTEPGHETVFYVEPSNTIKEDGKIVPNVNTTVDVQPGETQRQAAKFGNKLDSKGRPPLLSGSYGDDSVRFSAIQGDPFYGSDGTRLPKNKKWS